jgi:uncharacterized protein (DUF1499 family)
VPAPRQLADCGRRPNCVSSHASSPRRREGPWRLAAEPAAVWEAARRLVAALPRTRIVDSADFYLRAEARSRVFRFVDDLELLLDPESGTLAARSAARLGYSDRGVNRRRVRGLASALTAQGLLES